MRFFKSSALALTLGIASAVGVIPSISLAQMSVGVGIGISVDFAPPALPIYDQPPIPGPDYLWTPGYWAWDSDVQDYYWVPGAWVEAPEPGLLWTPAWWGWQDGVYLFHGGYWGDQIGFYGGIAYGFGYDGVGYEGGYWNGGHFFYNRTVNNITNVNITNVYTRQVTAGRTTVSYNGPGGVQARPTSHQLAADHARHIPPTPQQAQHIRMAASNPVLRASYNKGAPPIAATPKAGAFNDAHVVHAARAGGQWRPPSGTGQHGQALGAAGRPGPGRATTSGPAGTSGAFAGAGRPGHGPGARTAESAGASSAYVGPERRTHGRSPSTSGPTYSHAYERQSPPPAGFAPGGYNQRHAPQGGGYGAGAPAEPRRPARAPAGAFGSGGGGYGGGSPHAPPPDVFRAPAGPGPAAHPAPGRQGSPQDRRKAPGQGG